VNAELLKIICGVKGHVKFYQTPTEISFVSQRYVLCRPTKKSTILSTNCRRSATDTQNICIAFFLKNNNLEKGMVILKLWYYFWNTETRKILDKLKLSKNSQIYVWGQFFSLVSYFRPWYSSAVWMCCI